MDIKSDGDQTMPESPVEPEVKPQASIWPSADQTYDVDGDTSDTVYASPPEGEGLALKPYSQGADRREQFGGENGAAADDDHAMADSVATWSADPPSETETPANDAETPEEESPSGWTIAKAVIREIVETVVLTLVIFFLIQTVIRNFRVDGHSMDPNLQHGQYLVVDKISYKLPFDWREPERGDVIVFEPPTYPDKDFVKRIIGMPGEIVEIRQGQVYIDDNLLEEPFGAYVDRFSMSPQKVPTGSYFVMGDNRANSNDSRNWGALSTNRIIGRAWLSYWPPATWGTIPNNGPTTGHTLAAQLKNFFE